MIGIVGNVRRGKNMTSGEIRAAFLHNFRGSGYVQKFRNENIDKTRSDKNIIWLERDGKMAQVSTRELRDVEKIDALREAMQKKCEDDFRGLKDVKGRRRKFRKDFAPFSEFVLTFGTSREKSDGEALTREESEYINSRNFDENALAFIEKLRGLGYSNFQLVRHCDEKTQHYHVLCLNWSFEKHCPMRFNRFQLRDHGIKLQDMMAEVFADAGVLRGQRGSKRRHLAVKVSRAMRAEIREGVGEAVSSLWGSIKEKFVSYNEWKPRFLDNEPKYLYSQTNMENIQKAVRIGLQRGYFSIYPDFEKKYKELKDFASETRKICGYDEKKPLEAVLSELRFTKTRLDISQDALVREKNGNQASELRKISDENKELRETLNMYVSKNNELQIKNETISRQNEELSARAKKAENELQEARNQMLRFAEKYAAEKAQNNSLTVNQAYIQYISPQSKKSDDFLMSF